MARRRNSGSGEQLTLAELGALRTRLSAMRPYEVESFYKATHNACRYEVNGRVPSPRAMQELVTAWKALRVKARER